MKCLHKEMKTTVWIPSAPEKPSNHLQFQHSRGKDMESLSQANQLDKLNLQASGSVRDPASVTESN